jgi:hypothetical protein
MSLNRRSFLKFLGAATAVSAGGIALIETPKTFFLPPAGGWAQKLKIRKVQQYMIDTDSMPVTYAAAWTMLNGEARQYHIDTTHQWDDPHGDIIARGMLEAQMMGDGGSANCSQIPLNLPQSVRYAKYI